MICFNCDEYGHFRKLGQNYAICLQCSEIHGVVQGEKCNKTPHFMRCKKEHAVILPDCPKYKSEERIFCRPEDFIPGSETDIRRRNEKDSFANVVQDRLNHELSIKDQTIAALQKQVAALAKEFRKLREMVRDVITQPVDLQTYSSAATEWIHPPLNYDKLYSASKPVDSPNARPSMLTLTRAVSKLSGWLQSTWTPTNFGQVFFLLHQIAVLQTLLPRHTF